MENNNITSCSIISSDWNIEFSELDHDLELRPFIKAHQGNSLRAKSRYLPRKRFKRPKGFEEPGIISSIFYLSIIIIGGLPIILITYLAFPRTQAVGNLPYYDCTYTGKFTFQGIDLPFGEMTFAQAKAIDLCWNMIVGRGLQALFSVVACRVFMQVLLQIAESNNITYELYAALALFPTTIWTLWPVSRALISTSIRARFFLSWLFISIIYLLVFPTLADALSGYQASQLTMLKKEDGSSVDVSTGIKNSHALDRSLPPDSILGEYNITVIGSWDPSKSPNCYSLKVQVGNELDNGHLILACINATASRAYILFDSKTFDVVLDYADSSCQVWRPFTNREEPNPNSKCPNINKTTLQNQSNYECVSQDIYQWGFSYAFLLITSCITTFWIFGTWIVWVSAEENSNLVQKGRKGGKWRAILDLAEAAQNDLGPNTCAYAEGKIAAALSEQNKLRYRVHKNEDGTANIGLRSIEDEKLGQEEKFKLDWKTEYGA